ncbi:hypothetical protein ASO20_01825 [Mycoplasma sp. (ex Biomphalaria glabrata)]|uniref:hypothetical protein n=1 Tax=Mycoplasma sp. (ex Biomphalaria glabrata) TaxID=1749074 RepID=UPI00073AC799|nr:hypothetical protein [Mycoplasma sp. (ex Biomphalaria glabrata)]ALV23386.1 hypothetical protein ASO20_01825 [Mycoplasma sp. (ex Biomphalaria glabrata)]
MNNDIKNIFKETNEDIYESIQDVKHFLIERYRKKIMEDNDQHPKIISFYKGLHAKLTSITNITELFDFISIHGSKIMTHEMAITSSNLTLKLADYFGQNLVQHNTEYDKKIELMDIFKTRVIFTTNEKRKIIFQNYECNIKQKENVCCFVIHVSSYIELIELERKFTNFIEENYNESSKVRSHISTMFQE